MISTVLLFGLLAAGSATAHLDLHPEYQAGLSINGVPAQDREHWMRLANEAIYDDIEDPCPQAPFGSAIVHTTSNELICVAANKVGTTGDPTMHGEISTIRHCTDVLRAKGLSPQQILASWRDFTLYTNGEPCPMCMSSIRWAGFKEVVYGTSIGKIAEAGRNQIYIPSSYILEKSYSMGHMTLMLGNILTNETDIMFGHQFNESAPCPVGCSRTKKAGQRVSTCTAVANWRDVIRRDKEARGIKLHVHEEL